VINGTATQAQLARAFGVPLVTVKRYVKLHRQGGTSAFFVAPKQRSAIHNDISNCACCGFC
jgi:transposase-like protein